MNLCRISVETPVGLCVAVAGYAVVKSARTLDDDTRDGSLEETCRTSTTSTQKIRIMERNVLSKTFSSANTITVSQLSGT